MAIKKTQQGFALLIAIIFMSVMLSFGLTLGALAYKQQILASNAIESQYAFYAADAGLECALYADQQNGGQPSLFTVPATLPASAPLMTCDNVSATFPPGVPTGIVTNNIPNSWVITERLSLDAGKHCADVTIYKYNEPQANGITAYLFSQGYNVSCATVASPGGARFVSRGLNASY